MPRSLALLAALSACAGVRHDDKADTDTDPGPVDDTEATSTYDTYPDTAPVEETAVDDTETGAEDTGDGYFRPTQITYVAEFAVDATPVMRGFSVQRTPFPAYFAVLMSDGVATCRIDYDLDPAAFGWSGEEGLDPSLASFLATNAQLFGFKVAPGLYTATTSSVCDDLPPGLTTDLPADALTLFATNVTPVIYVGIDQAPEPGVVTAITGSTSLKSWVTADNVLGGRMVFPFLFGTSAGGTSNFFSNGGLMGVVDELFDVQLNGTGLLLHPAADAWTGTQPGLGYYWVIPTNGFTLSWTP